MSYSLPADVAELIPNRDLIDLTDDEATGLVVTSRVTSAIESADELINSYASTAGYLIPLSPVPGSIREISARLAIGTLFSRIGRDLKNRQAQRDEDLAWLKNLAKGMVRIGSNSATPPTSSGSSTAQSTHKESDRILSKPKLDEGGF